MAFDQQGNENKQAVLVAVISALMCLPALFLATRPVIWVIHAPWNEGLLSPLFILMPIFFTFLILYHSAWHQEWIGLKRLLLSIVAACFIFGFNLFLLVAIAALGAFCPRFLAGH